MLRRLWRVLAIDDDLSALSREADVGLHLWQQAGSDLVFRNPVPINVFALDLVAAVNAIEVPDEALVQDRHLLPVAGELPKPAAPRCLRYEEVSVDQLTDLHQEIVEPVVPM